MKSNLSKLLALASEPISRYRVAPIEIIANYGSHHLVQELSGFLAQRNGFFAYEKALYVRPFDVSMPEYGLSTWNAQSNWRNAYQGLADNCLFFAEDIFGDQFAIQHGGIVRFKPETGDVEAIADSLDGWADAILQEPEVETGYPVALNWTATYGAFANNQRLIPKTFFVIGGGYELENFYAFDCAESLRLRAEFAIQISELPDGQAIDLNISE